MHCKRVELEDGKGILNFVMLAVKQNTHILMETRLNFDNKRITWYKIFIKKNKQVDYLNIFTCV